MIKLVIKIFFKLKLFKLYNLKELGKYIIHLFIKNMSY